MSAPPSILTVSSDSPSWPPQRFPRELILHPALRAQPRERADADRRPGPWVGRFFYGLLAVPWLLPMGLVWGVSLALGWALGRIRAT